MARTRNIKPGFFKNEDLADLGPHAMILFSGLWCWADRKGVLENRPRLLKAEIMPYFDVDVPTLIADLERKGFIVVFQDGGKSYIHIPTFVTHQNPHQNEKDSGFPLPLERVTPSNGASDGAHTPGTEWLGEGGKKKEEGGKKKEASTRRQEEGPSRSEQIRAVFDHYRTHHPHAHKKPCPPSKEWKAIDARLTEGYSVPDLCQAIDGCHKCPHNLGQNERQQQYLGLELIMRTGSQVARFMEIEAKGTGPPVLSQKTQRTIEAGKSWLDRKRGDDGQE